MAGKSINEIRQDITTKEWVIYAPGRKKRPHDFRQEISDRKGLAAYDEKCPFCPGNESMLPEVIMELEDKEEKRWNIRVVPNKYPALSAEGSNRRLNNGIHIFMEGYGRHEVIIESRFHNQDIATMSPADAGLVIDAYHRRYVELMKEHRNALILIFRNHGVRAGTSLSHPHSQLIVTGMVPHHIRIKEREAQQYFDDWGKCIYCDILEFERKEGKRAVLENDSFLAFVPFAADVPFEVWIMPKRHQACFCSISEKEKADLSAVLQKVLFNIYAKLNDPDYNYIINTFSQYKTEEPQLHWYVQIRPRLTTPAGFEIGSGMNINPSLPEDDASFLKEGTG